jgi:hypothetical protein
MAAERAYYKLSQLYVGVAGCPVLVRVEEADPIKYIDKISVFKGVWVVMDQDGGKADVDFLHKDEEEVRKWATKLPPGRVVVMEDFRVLDQKSLR